MALTTARNFARIAFAVAAISVTSESGGAQVAELLHKLDLTVYERRTVPPEFNGHATDGREVSLASQQGKLVLVNFWATWCLECRAEMPALERLHREFSSRGLAIMGVNVREGTKAINEYARQLGLTIPLILDPRGTINSAYGVVGLPTTFLVGRDGRAVALAIGPKEWNGQPARALILALLAEQTGLKGARQ